VSIRSLCLRGAGDRGQNVDDVRLTSRAGVLLATPSPMADCQITCVTRDNRPPQHEHITHVGHPPEWVWPVSDVIQSIEAGTNTFFVIDSRTGLRAEVGVVRPFGRFPYLRTYADGVPTDNLLSLDRCPVR
jgi:hypothetical protein